MYKFLKIIFLFASTKIQQEDKLKKNLTSAQYK